MLKKVWFDTKIIFLEWVLTFLWSKQLFLYLSGGHLEKWWPFWNFTWLTYFSKQVPPDEYLYHIWCLYHHLKDYYSYLQQKTQFSRSAVLYSLDNSGSKLSGIFSCRFWNERTHNWKIWHQDHLSRLILCELIIKRVYFGGWSVAILKNGGHFEISCG